MAHASQDEGTALAKVLFGEYNPGGHLVSTWPKSIDQLPPSMDYNIRDGYTYMYFKGEPLYPVRLWPELYDVQVLESAHQLSTIGQGRHDHRQRGRDQYRQPRGRRRGSDVCEAPGLEGGAAAGRVEGIPPRDHQPKETKTVKIPLQASSLAWWDEKLPGFRVEAEPVRVMVGNSSSDIQASTTVRVE